MIEAGENGLLLFTFSSSFSDLSIIWINKRKKEELV